jgi:hypothetical protein
MQMLNLRSDQTLFFVFIFLFSFSHCDVCFLKENNYLKFNIHNNKTELIASLCGGGGFGFSSFSFSSSNNISDIYVTFYFWDHSKSSIVHGNGIRNIQNFTYEKKMDSYLRGFWKLTSTSFYYDIKISNNTNVFFRCNEASTIEKKFNETIWSVPISKFQRLSAKEGLF